MSNKVVPKLDINEINKVAFKAKYKTPISDKLSNFTPGGGLNEKKSTYKKRIFTNEKDIDYLKIMQPAFKIKVIDTVVFILVLLNFTLSFISNNLFTEETGSAELKNFKAKNHSDSKINIIRCFNVLIVIAIEVLIFFSYILKVEIYKIRDLAGKNEGIFTVGLYKTLIIEMLIMSIVTPPFFDKTFEGRMLGSYYIYSYDTVITIVSLIKMYYIIKIVGHYSIFTSFNAEKLAESKKRRTSFAFAFKSHLNSTPYLMISLLFFITAIFLTCMLRATEYGYNPNASAGDISSKSISNPLLKSYFDVFWLTIITMTTVGYGELYPYTHIGRFLMFLGAMSGTFIISLLISFLSSNIEFDAEQKKAHALILKLESIQRMKIKAGETVRLFAKFYLTTKKLKETQIKKESKIFVMHRAINTLSFSSKHFSKEYKSVQNFFLPSDKVLLKLEHRLSRELTKFIDSGDNLDIVREKTLKINDDEKRIATSLKNIDFLLNDVMDFCLKVNTLVEESKSSIK